MNFLARGLRYCCSTFRTISPQTTYQSRYYVPKVSVEEFLNRNHINYKQTNTGFQLRECPFCPKPHNNEISNLYTLSVHRQNGMFNCFRCTSRGSWVHLRGRILGADDSVASMAGETNQQSQNEAPQEPFTEVEFFLFKQNMKKEEFKDVVDYLVSERQLTLETIEKYKLGAGIQKFVDEVGESVDVKVIYFPMFRLYSEKERKLHEKQLHDYIAIRYGGSSEAANLGSFQNNRINSSTACISKTKIRGVGAQNKKYMRQFPTGNRPGLFGLNLMTQTTKEVVITEGEYDAMSVYQETGLPSLSLPQGAGSLPDNVLPYLESIEKIYLWMDNDEVGLLNAPKIASKLGENRCFIVTNPNVEMKDANDVLRQNKSLIKVLLQKAQTIPGQSILRFENLQERVRSRLLNMDKNIGVKSNEFKFFNRKVKGLRTGELTILSGGTGSGKTTLLSQMSVDFCKKGVATMWGSFEVQNEILVSSMLAQFSNINLSKHPQKIEQNFAKFQELPLYYMSFFGSTDLEKVFSTIEYSIEKYGISHIVIDTLQFLLSDQAVGFAKFDLQDSVMSRLRRIATELSVHVTVVIHPRKTEQGEDIGLHSIFGSSKSVQEADNVWMIQQRENFKIFQVKKNRFDGELGKIGLGFDRSSKKFFELTHKELELLLKKAATMEDIVEQRRGTTEEDQDLQNVIMGQPDHPDGMLQKQWKRSPSNPYQ